MIPISAQFPDELTGTLQLGPPYRGRQVFSWIHDRLVFDFAEMSDLPAVLREELARRAQPIGLKEDTRMADSDGAVKFRFHLADGSAIESVILRDRRGRATACLSTQVGCAMGCLFCRTGSLGFTRDLNAHEIVDQFLLLRSFIKGEDQQAEGRVVEGGVGEGAQDHDQQGQDQPGHDQAGADRPATDRPGNDPPPRSLDLSSVVFMGMGEPLANLDNLVRAVEVLAYSGFSQRRITVSTCGLVEGICSLGHRSLDVRLAVSLLSADPEVRNRLMPIGRSNPLPELRRALFQYQKETGKRMTLEIVLIDRISDRPEDAEALVQFVRGGVAQPALKVLINLIPWNPLPDFPYKRPGTGQVEWFQQRIRQAGIPVTTRLSRGSAVCGACGQLG